MGLHIEVVDWEAMSWEQRLSKTLTQLDARRRQIEKHKKTPEQKCIELHDLFQELAKATPWAERPTRVGICPSCGNSKFVHVADTITRTVCEYRSWREDDELEWVQVVDDTDIEFLSDIDYECYGCGTSVLDQLPEKFISPSDREGSD